MVEGLIEPRAPVRLPHGVRDYLPAEAAERRAIVTAMAEAFARSGYLGIVTPLYEYDEVLRRGLAVGSTSALRAMRFVEPSTGEVVTLRPDLTPQVARVVATRLADVPGPLRLAYEGSVVRLSGPGAGQEGELYQVGVELIDAPELGGDLEVIALAVEALKATGLRHMTVDLGSATFLRAALEGLGADDAKQSELEAALLKKDVGAVSALAGRLKLPEKRRALLRALPTLHGGLGCLERARKLTDSKPALLSLATLERVSNELAVLAPDVEISFDFGDIRSLEYYTGSRFAIYTPGASGAVVSGGRYDGLCERYGRSARATGFAVDVNQLLRIKDRARGTASLTRSGYYIGGDPLFGARLAARLRARGERVVVDLDETSPGDARLRELAERHQVARMLVVEPTRLRWLDLGDGAERRGSLGRVALEKLLADPASALDALTAPR